MAPMSGGSSTVFSSVTAFFAIVDVVAQRAKAAVPARASATTIAMAPTITAIWAAGCGERSRPCRATGSADRDDVLFTRSSRAAADHKSRTPTGVWGGGSRG